MLFGTDFRVWDPAPSSLHLVISIKSARKPTKFCNKSFDSEFEKPARDHSVFVSCWAIPCRLRIGFLVGPSCARMRFRPAFFMFRRCLVRRRFTPSEATMLPSVRPSKHHPFYTAGTQTARQMPRIFQSFSRNEAESVHSGIFVLRRA